MGGKARSVQQFKTLEIAAAQRFNSSIVQRQIGGNEAVPDVAMVQPIFDIERVRPVQPLRSVHHGDARSNGSSRCSRSTAMSSSNRFDYEVPGLGSFGLRPLRAVRCAGFRDLRASFSFFGLKDDAQARV
jgi:hypothetical protein